MSGIIDQTIGVSSAAMPRAEGSNFVGVGAGLNSIGDALMNIEHVHNETATNDVYTNDFSPKFRDLYQQYYSLQGKDAVAQMPQFADSMEKLRNQSRVNLQNSAQQHMFDMMSTKRIEYELDGMARYADQQNKVYQSQTHDATLQNYSNQAADKYNDDYSFGTALGSGKAEIERYGMSTGQSAEMIRANTDKYVSGVTLDRLQRWLADDPVKAQEWYTNNSGLIEADKRPIIEHQIKTAVLPVEAKNIADQVIHPPIQDGQPDASAQSTAVDTRANLGTWISQAEQLADEKRPNDPVFRDMVVQQVKGYMSNIAAAQEGVQRQAQQALMSAAIGQNRPTTIDGLLSIPGARQAWVISDPNAQRGIIALLEHNAKAANGEFTRSDPALFNDLRQRIWLPDGDPQKLTSPTQLTQYFAHGLNYPDSERIKKELADSNTPEGNPFLKQVNQVKETARKMMVSSNFALNHADLANEAAYRFSVDLDNRIKDMRAAGKDPQTLFTPGTQDYALSPNRVAAFMPSETDIVASKARGVQSPSPAVNYPTATNQKTGQKMMFKEGKWQPLQ